MAMLRNDKNKRPQANKLFTDREEPRKVFWDTYNRFKENIQNAQDNEIKVITYYGIGGIGKTSLLKQIKNELTTRVEKPLILMIDFEENPDTLAVLTKIRNLLQNTYHFDFPMFDLAYFAYMQKQGHQIKKEEIESFISSSPMLNTLIEFSSIIPGTGTILSLLKGVDSLSTTIRNKLDHRKRELNEIKNDEPDLLLKNMPYYLSCDIENHLEKQKEPLIILLDTYEVLVNELASIGTPLDKDKWLRHEERGLVVNIPNTIWVIAGRDKLKWEQINSEWEGTLDQHLLGSLSDVDAEHFLYEAGISDRNFISDIYQLTNGVPLYLDICVDRYHALVDKGETPTIADLGSNTYELISRFVKYMDDHKKALVYLLSCLEDWSDDLLGQLVQAFLPSVPFTTVSSIKNYSFISTEVLADLKASALNTSALNASAHNKEIFKMHPSIRKIVYSDCDKNIAQKVNLYMKAYYMSCLSADELQVSEYGNTLKKSVIYALRCGFESDDLFINFFKTTFMPFNEKLIHRFLYHEAIQTSELLLAYVKSTDTEGIISAYCELNHATAHYFAGHYSVSLDYSIRAFESFKNHLGESHLDTLKAMQLTILNYRRAGQYTKSLSLSQNLYGQIEAVYGKKNEVTIDALINLAIAYRKIGNFGEAVKISEVVYDFKRETLGIDHPSTLNAMSSLANAYRQSGDYPLACELSEKVVQYRLSVDGESHPYTLAAKGSLSHSYRLLENYDLATTLAEQVVAGRRELLGEDHPLTIKGMNNLANSYRKTGQYEDALHYAEKVYQNRLEAAGEDYPGTMGALSNLATSYRKLGEFEKSHALALEVYKWRIHKFGDFHPATLRAMNNLANVLDKLGIKEEANKMRLDLIEIAQAHYPQTHPAITTARYNLSHTDHLDVDEEDSEDLAEEDKDLFKHLA